LYTPEINYMTEQIIGNRYILQKEVGSGGMGTVYLGLDTLTHHQVAIKQLKSDVAQPEIIERFKREGEALRDLNHPNIVKMLDMFEHDGQYYLVMEYVTGGDLSDLLKQGQMSLEQILNLSIDLADALTRAHRLNIIHRDLKPANILLADDDTLRLTDFGVAHVGSKERVTETDAIIGTLDYLPPEAFDGTPFDARGDIWAFGVILFEMLAGTRPFRGDTLFEVIQAITMQPIPDLEALCPDIQISLIDLVYRMLERNPHARIPSVRHVGAVLEDILQGRDKAIATKRFDTPVPDYSSRPKHNLPVQPTPFVGREHELAELETLLKDSTMRLITILAQGGMGKTRLVLELAQHALDQDLYADGVYFVELAPISDADNIPNAIADAAGYQFLGDGTPKEQLLTIIRERNLLLVMDNYEHLSEGFALVSDIIKSAPNVYIIATSRQRLSQAGETLFHLSGMDFPDWETPEDALEYAAVKLFMNSAKRVRPDFELLADNLDVVARICKLVQGMPLGIVLAASWLAVLSLSEIADEIQNSLDFLETDETDLPERQRSIRVVMDYSWAQMTEAEQQVFMKLSVFLGGFTREAAEAVADANLWILMSLVKKSLIRRDANSGRYEIHELLRQYSMGQLNKLLEKRLQTVDNHCGYYAKFMEEQWSRLTGSKIKSALINIGVELENVRAAWGWAVNHRKATEIESAMRSLWFYYGVSAHSHEGEQVFANAVSAFKNTPLYGKLMAHLGELTYKHGSTEKAQLLLEESLHLLHLSGARWERAFVLNKLVMMSIGSSLTLSRPVEYLEESLAIFTELDDLDGMSEVLGTWGTFYLFQYIDDPREAILQRAQHYYEKALDAKPESLFKIANARSGLSDVAILRKDYKQGFQHAQTSRIIFQDLGIGYGIRKTIAQVGYTAYKLGDYTESRQAVLESLRINFEHRFQTEYGENRIILWILNDLHLAAAILADEGEQERAYELLGFVDQQYHHINIHSNDFDYFLLHLLDENLSPQLTEAVERGRGRDLETVILELLEEFGNNP
jgi:predicted ATPase